jgi:hypothetical protein
MKLIGSKLEKEIKEGLIESKQRICNISDNNHLRKALFKIKPNFKTAYILNWFPEQGENIYTIITDDKDIIELEISRVDLSSEPIWEIYNINEYRKQLRGKPANLRLIIALNLIDEDLRAKL